MPLVQVTAEAGTLIGLLMKSIELPVGLVGCLVLHLQLVGSFYFRCSIFRFQSAEWCVCVCVYSFHRLTIFIEFMADVNCQSNSPPFIITFPSFM